MCRPSRGGQRGSGGGKGAGAPRGVRTAAQHAGHMSCALPRALAALCSRRAAARATLVPLNSSTTSRQDEGAERPQPGGLRVEGKLHALRR